MTDDVYRSILSEETDHVRACLGGLPGTFPDSLSSEALLGFVAARLAALRWSAMERMRIGVADLLAEACPGLAEPLPPQAWLAPASPVLRPIRLEPGTRLVREPGTRDEQRWTTRPDLPAVDLLPVRECSLDWSLEHSGVLELRIALTCAASPAVVTLSLTGEVTRWDCWLMLRTARRAVCEWDGPAVESKWCGSPASLWDEPPLAPAFGLAHLRSGLCNLDARCQLRLRLPRGCAGWTQLTVRFEVTRSAPRKPLGLRPRIDLVPVCSRDVLAVAWHPHLGAGPLQLRDPRTQVIRLQRVLRRFGPGLEECPVHGFTLQRRLDGQGNPQAWLCLREGAQLPASAGGYVAELETCTVQDPSPSLSREPLFRVAGAGVATAFQQHGPQGPFLHPLSSDAIGRVLPALLRVLLRGGDGAGLTTFLQGLGMQAMPADHPVHSMVGGRWNLEQRVLALGMAKPGTSGHGLEGEGRVLAFCECLREFWLELVPAWGDLRVEIADD